jgi:hypothetical protein
MIKINKWWSNGLNIFKHKKLTWLKQYTPIIWLLLENNDIVHRSHTLSIKQSSRCQKFDAATFVILVILLQISLWKYWASEITLDRLSRVKAKELALCLPK